MRRFFVAILGLLVSAALSAASATFKKIWLEHNVMQDGEKGMKVHVAFDISGMKGQKCKAIAYFDHPKGTGVKDRNGRYCTTDGNVCSSTQFTPGYPNTTYSDLSIFIPNSELHLLSGKRTYYTRVFIQMPNGKFLANSNFASFDGTGSNASNSNNYANNNANRSNNISNGSGRRWREDAGYGMFYDCQEMNGGMISKTLYGRCTACRGTSACGGCYGTAVCSICQGRGGIITAGYGNYIPCAACYQSGRCQICKGTGKCVCASSDFPGYVPGSNTLYGADGRIISTNSFRSGGSSSSSSSSSSSRSSSHSSRGTCSKCGGRRYESTAYQHAAASGSGWAQPYHNAGGSSCPYCNYKTDHYHYPCTECRGFGHN